jgi:glutamate synthase (NADPH) small chain
MPLPPTTRTAYMPWPLYPMVLRTSTSHEEGCERQFSVVTKAFLGDTQGRLRALQIAELEWQSGQDGRPGSFSEKPGTLREIPCEAAFLAMGFVHPQHSGMLHHREVALDERGNVRANDQTYQTNIAKVFAAGDMRRGQSLVVWAIQEGRECARHVDAYLMP